MFQEKNDAFNLFSIYYIKNLIKITSTASQKMNRESSKFFHQDGTRFWIKLKPKKILLLIILFVISFFFNYIKKNYKSNYINGAIFQISIGNDTYISW